MYERTTETTNDRTKDYFTYVNFGEIREYRAPVASFTKTSVFPISSSVASELILEEHGEREPIMGSSPCQWVRWRSSPEAESF